MKNKENNHSFAIQKDKLNNIDKFKYKICI